MQHHKKQTLKSRAGGLNIQTPVLTLSYFFLQKFNVGFQLNAAQIAPELLKQVEGAFRALLRIRLAIKLQNQCQCNENEMKSVLITQTQNSQHSTIPVRMHKSHMKQCLQYGIFKVQHADNQAHRSRQVDHHFTQIIDSSGIRKKEDTESLWLVGQLLHYHTPFQDNAHSAWVELKMFINAEDSHWCFTVQVLVS